MRKTVERGALVGLGALSLTREKAQTVAGELEKRGLANRKHARGWVRQLAARGQTERAALRDLVHKQVDATLKRAGLANARDVAALNRRLAALERETKSRGPNQRTETP